MAFPRPPYRAPRPRTRGVDLGPAFTAYALLTLFVGVFFLTLIIRIGTA